MEKEHRADFALASNTEAAPASDGREQRRRRQQRAASQSENREADEQRLAIQDRMLAALSAGDVRSLLGDGPSSATQTNKAEFLAQLRVAVEGAANQELGVLGSAAGCPYIESYFGKYEALPAAAAELLLRRWVPKAVGAASARDLIPLVVARVRTGVQEWSQTGALPADLSAADPHVAALAPAAKAQQAQAAAATGSAAPTSLDAMEAELGTGQALDGATTSRLGATGATDVRIHTGSAAAAKAAQHNAVAFAVGNNIVMGAGAPTPGTLLGDALLAHELAHTAQQRDAATDPAARKRPIGSEDAAAETNADETALAAYTGKDPALAGLSAMGSRFGDVMKTGLQLQRCSSDNTASMGKVPTSDLKGRFVGSAVAFVPTANGAIPIAAGRVLGSFKNTDAAVAALRANGRGGAIAAEDGLFVAYEILDDVPEFGTRMSSYGGNQVGRQSMEPTSVAPGVLLLINQNGTILRPGATLDNATSNGAVTAEDRGQQKGDPFQGYIDAFGDGKSLNNASDAQILVTFDSAMKDTALSVLARSEADVRTKKAKYDKGTGKDGVGKDEIENLRQTAKDLVPVVKDLDYSRAVVDVGMKQMTPSMPSMSGNTPIMPPMAPMFSGQEIADAMERIKKLEPQRAAILSRAPMLARIPELKLAAFAALPADQIVARMGSEMPGVLTDIETTRGNILDGGLDLWEVDSVVNATLAGLGIKDEAKRKLILDKQKAKAHDKTVSTIVRTVFSVAFGLAAAFATGGLSVAFAAGAFGLGLYDAVEQTNDYFEKKAAANTDLDPNAAMLPKELVPGWGWLVVAWVGVGLDASQVVTSIKAIGKVERIAAEARVLSQKEYQRLGFASAEALESKLKSAAGIVDTGQTITEASRGVVAAKVGTSIEIHAGLPAGQIEVHYVVEAGRVRVVGMKVAEGASVAEVLAHSEVVRLLKRYEGATGRVRELIDRLRSFAGVASKDANPFPAGSKAFESWLEAKKLPAIIEARTQRLGSAVGTAQESRLRADVEFLEHELAHHEGVVEAMQIERGAGFVASYGDASKAALQRGLHLPDVAPGTELTDEVIRNSGYYYRKAGSEFELVRKMETNGKGLKPAIGADGKQIFENGLPKFIPNDDLTRAERAAELVATFPKDKQTAYEAYKVAQEALGNKVVPVQGIFVTGKTFKQVAKGSQDFRTKLIGHMKDAFVASGKGETEAAKLATEAADRFLAKEITVIQGTDQLRAFGYQAHYVKTTGTAAEELEELHHVAPLYLGGDHTVANLLNVPGELHDKIHKLLSTLNLEQGLSIAPASMRNMNVAFSPGLAVIESTGVIEFRTLAQIPVKP